MTSQTTENTGQTGGCYCGAVRYSLTEAPIVKGQCHCVPCRVLSGGGPHYFLLVPPTGFTWTKGVAASYRRSDLENAVTRYFCGACGTQMITRRQDNPAVVVKVGTLDDPTRFRPRVAICHKDALDFHVVPDGIPIFEDLPGV